jgi:membrane protein DedA with SNARE-associated domain
VDYAALIQTHGYWALALGCLLEGEAVLALAGFAAHRGYLQLHWVMAIAALAGFAGDQCFFWLGRRHASTALRFFPKLQRQSGRLQQLVEMHPVKLIIGMRFAYGLRIAAPILVGNSAIAAGRFALLNAVGAIVWAFVFATLGWSFGQMVESVLGDIRYLEGWLSLALVSSVLGYALWRRWRNRTGT